MATRKQRALSHLSQSLMQMGQQFTQDDLIRKRQADENAAQLQQMLTGQLLTGQREQANRQAAAADKVASDLRQREQSALLTLLGSTSGASTLNDLATEEDLPALFESAGVPEAQRPLFSRARQARLAALGNEANKATTGVDFVDPTDPTGTAQRAYLPTRELVGQTFQTAPSATQAGTAKLATAQAGELNPLYAVAEARHKNEMERLTRSEQVRTAQAVAEARKRGDLAFVAQEEDRERRLAAARSQGTTTEAERRAAGQLSPLIQAEMHALEAENSKVRLPPDVELLVSSPLYKSTLGSRLSPGQQQYLQAATDWTNAIAYIRSGTTVRADEFPRYLMTYFSVGDESATLVKQKQDSRNTLQAALSIGAGRSGEEAGRAVAQGIMEGRIPEDTLVMFNFTPDVMQGIKRNLKYGPDGSVLVRKP